MDKPSKHLQGSIISETPNVKWDDVVGLELAKSELQAAIIFALRFPQMFRDKRQFRPNILLYGPPGTGKSCLAKAVATEVNRTLFTINIRKVISKGIGECEELIRHLFQVARDEKPSIIFLDEVDAISRDVSDADSEHMRRIRTELLFEVDDLESKKEGVFTLAATNSPWDLDPTVRKRFRKRIHIPLPGQQPREELFKVHLYDMAPTLVDNKEALVALARRTEGYSGSDIADLIQDAVMTPVEEVHLTAPFHKTRGRDGEYYTPRNPDAECETSIRWNQVPSHGLKEPPLSLEDLYGAIKRTKPSTTEGEAQKCVEWMREYGEAEGPF